jgi:predicted transcriptional regulator
MSIPPQLLQISSRVQEGASPVFVTPREILGWFGRYRRTWRQVNRIRTVLSELELETSPDFEGAGFDEPLVIEPSQASVMEQIVKTDGIPVSPEAEVLSDGSSEVVEIADPVHRVSRFLRTGELVRVSRDEEVSAAVTKMLLNDYSQLPVMQGERVQGMISWRSIGQRKTLSGEVKFVRECMESHHEIKAEDSIFQAIAVVRERDSVLVRSKENKIIGILTATDISECFEQVSRPFLFLSYTENHLRALIQSKFSVSDLKSAKDPADTEREIASVADMTFGEYVRLLENPENWKKLQLNLERSLFVHQLNVVRGIRNDVMHFNPEGIEDEDMEALRRFNTFLELLVANHRR